MATSAILGMSRPGESIQREQRDYHEEWTDQHGRKFGWHYDRSNGRPIGEPTPIGCSPPWLPPMRFIIWDKKGGFRFSWDYQTMADELGGQTASYYQDAVKFAIENNKPEPEVGGPVDRSIRYVLGVPPMSPAIPLAAAIGDPYILGIAGAKPNESLKAILEQNAGANGREAIEFIKKRMQAQAADSNVALIPSVALEPEVEKKAKTINDPAPLMMDNITYQQFLSECKGRKMTMPDIVAAWNEHKKNLAESVAA